MYGKYGQTSVVVAVAGSWLLLVLGGEPTPDQPTVTLRTSEDRRVAGTEVILTCVWLPETCRLLSSRGVAFLAEPHAWGSEVRTFFVDPDGHLFEISERSG